jgi:type IV secretory pathway TrbD component
MDDGPRTGGLQALLVIIGGTAAYVTFGAGVWGAAPFMVAALGLVIWLEMYARRRAREEERARQRRLRERALAHLDYDHDPFDSR